MYQFLKSLPYSVAILIFSEAITTVSDTTEQHSSQHFSTNTGSNENYETADTTVAKSFSSSSSFNRESATEAVPTDTHTVYTTTETVSAETLGTRIVPTEALPIKNLSTETGSTIFVTTEAQKTVTHTLDKSSTKTFTTTDSYDSKFSTASVPSEVLALKNVTTEDSVEGFSTEMKSKIDEAATTNASNMASITDTLSITATTTFGILQEDITTDFSATENWITDDAFEEVVTSTKATSTKDLFTALVTPSSTYFKAVTTGDLYTISLILVIRT